MANYEDQVRAIWSALDKMVEQDPEGYKRFVTEQLQEGQRMLKKEVSSCSNSKNKTGQRQTEELTKAFRNLSLSRDTTTTNHTLERQGNIRDKKSNCNRTKNTVKPQKNYKEDQETTSLLDDEIGQSKSIITQIVKKTDWANDEEEECVKLDSLRVSAPKDESCTKSTKPLIEEI